ncbi:hypothetical protein AZOA_12110 [Azoarcus sp. Aa7]|nr:hypothetical protein [Azoarcus sp. Aa7]
MGTVISHRLTVAEFVKRKLVATGRSLEDVAVEMGVSDAEMLMGVVEGREHLPAQLVYPLARCLDVDPAHLMRIFLRDYLPDVEQAIHDCGGRMVVTERERSLLIAYQKCTADDDPEVLIFEDKQVVALALK